jgi:diguanylate cyclase (GGDEF)-like protein
VKAPDFQSEEIPATPNPWDNAPMRLKVGLLMALAAVGGSLVGMIEVSRDYQAWPYLLGMTVLGLGLFAFGRIRLWGPIEELLTHVRRDWKAQRPIRQSHLPINRNDEIGQLATILHELSIEAYRQGVLEKNLRRTIDQRVSTATHKATRQLEQLAMRDPLTGLANRRFLDSSFEELIVSCRQSNTGVAVVAMDLDNFKAVNDTLGHAVGDWLLKKLAEVIGANVRESDFCVRLGGDEFILILPGADASNVKRCMENITLQFGRQSKHRLPENLWVGISAGVELMNPTQEVTGSELIDAADGRLYQAKQAGKGVTIGVE